MSVNGNDDAVTYLHLADKQGLRDMEDERLLEKLAAEVNATDCGLNVSRSVEVRQFENGMYFRE